MNRMLPALAVLGLLAFAGTAEALETDELIAITAMPLAVADVVALPDVPQDEVLTVVTTLNHAAVPAPQFVEIVRYIPIALAEPAEPRFVTYVTQEYQRGTVGEPLALAIADRYDSYGIDDFDIADPPVMTFVERQEFLPEIVVTRFQPVEYDPLALVAMPLAVAAVADLVDIPRTDLMRFVASLNQARVPAPQFVEVVRYSPVMLIDRTESPRFLQFVTTEVDRGVIGRPLAYVIADRYEAFAPIEIDVVAPRPRVIVERDEFLPPLVVSRVARAHPHGGPPGQLKKELGLQTGAEVVHRSVPARTARVRQAEVRRREVRRRAVARDDQRQERRQRVTREPSKRVVRAERAEPRVRKEQRRAASEVRSSGNERKQKARVSAQSGGNSGGKSVKQRGAKPGGGGENRGNSGGGKGKGKSKG